MDDQSLAWRAMEVWEIEKAATKWFENSSNDGGRILVDALERIQDNVEVAKR